MAEPVTLLSFEEAVKAAEGAGDNKHALLGNGFSIGAHPPFAYGSLYEKALKSGLSEHVRALFKQYGTTNFEEVLRNLSVGIWLADHYKLKQTASALDMGGDRDRIKEALVGAIASVHPASRVAVSDAKLLACAGFLEHFHNIFTTNYDLLLYWAFRAKPSLGFNDGFSGADPEPLVFGNVPSNPNEGQHFIYYLHGALHLEARDGEVRKMRWGGVNLPLVDQIKEALAEDRFPLVVSEGASAAKRERIEASSYLSACRKNFRKISGSLFVFGSSLGDEDRHILDWIAMNGSITTLYVGMHGNPEEERNQLIVARMRSAVGSVYARPRRRAEFYDSDTARVWATPPEIVGRASG